MVKNPFTPTDGSNPPLFADRKDLIDTFKYSLHNTINLSPRHLIFLGSAGTGKTSLLHMLITLAESYSFIPVLIKAYPISKIEDLITILLNHLSRTLTKPTFKKMITSIGNLGISFLGTGITLKQERITEPQLTLIEIFKSAWNSIKKRWKSSCIVYRQHSLLGEEY